MSNVINFIKENGFGALPEQLGIKVKEYKENDVKLFVLNYDQIESPKTHLIVVECRGMIVDEHLNILCHPFNRFFNLGEAPETQSCLDMQLAVAFEKVDGSLIKLWWNPYGNRWEIATRGTAFAESTVGGFNLTFRELVLKALDKTEEEFQREANIHLDKRTTYLCEVTSMENRVVTPYRGYTLHYLGSRDNETGKHNFLVSRKEAEQIGVKAIKQYSFSNTKDALEAANALGGLEEGFVVWQVVDGEFQPICKIKSDAYLACHHIRGEGLTPRRIAELVLSGEHEEYLTYFKEDEHRISPYVSALASLLEEMYNVYEGVKNIPEQKEFALAIKNYNFAPVLFTARKTGEGVAHCFNQCRLSWKVDILKGKVE